MNSNAGGVVPSCLQVSWSRNMQNELAVEEEEHERG